MIIVFNLPSGEQRLVDVHPTGGIADDLETVWHEGHDGPLSGELRAQVGGLVRVGKSVVFSEARQQQHNATLTAETAAKASLIKTSAEQALLAMLSNVTGSQISEVQRLFAAGFLEEINLIRDAMKLPRRSKEDQIQTIIEQKDSI